MWGAKNPFTVTVGKYSRNKARLIARFHTDYIVLMVVKLPLN